jgi:hypothetical protein
MQSVQIGDWLIKASSLDDQIFICGYKQGTVYTFAKMFYDEESAFSFMEKIYDQDYKTHLG